MKQENTTSGKSVASVGNSSNTFLHKHVEEQENQGEVEDELADWQAMPN